MLRPRPAGADSNHTPLRQLEPGRRARACPRRAVALLLGLILLGRGAPAGAARAEDDFSFQLKTVSSVRFVGVHHVPKGELRRALRTRPPSIWPWASRTPFRPDFLVSDTSAIRIVYQNRGYLDAQVDSVTVRENRNAREVAITYAVREGALSEIRDVAFDGVQNCPEPALRKVLHARPGRP